MSLYIETIILGVLQGVTEYLPISSSAHLTLVPQMAGWNSPLLNSPSFDVALHLGTLLAVAVYFWRDILGLTASFLSGLASHSWWQEEKAKLAWCLVLATVPAVILALVADHFIETVFRGPGLIALWLIVFGLVMAAAEAYTRKQKNLPSITFADAVWLGLAQALALFPGVSRSGVTIAAGLFLGFKRDEAARFSFLLSIPAVLGAVVFHGRHLLGAARDQSWMILLLGILVSAATGYGVIKFLLAYLQKRTLYIFVVYRVLLGLAIVGWILAGQAK